MAIAVNYRAKTCGMDLFFKMHFELTGCKTSISMNPYATINRRRSLIPQPSQHPMKAIIDVLDPTVFGGRYPQSGKISVHNNGLGKIRLAEVCSQPVFRLESLSK